MELIFYGFAFWFGGTVYQALELWWRRRTHWSMFLAGGLCAILLELLCNGVFFALPLFFKCILGSLIITGVEFSVGCIVNLGFGMNVWDYSGFRFHLLGQVCLFYSALWAVLTLPALWILNLLHTLIV